MSVQVGNIIVFLEKVQVVRLFDYVRLLGTLKYAIQSVVRKNNFQRSVVLTGNT